MGQVLVFCSIDHYIYVYTTIKQKPPPFLCLYLHHNKGDQNFAKKKKNSEYDKKKPSQSSLNK